MNPPPYNLPIRMKFGKLMPKDKEDGDKKKKKAKKAAPKKGKDEKPPKPIVWADIPEPKGPDTLDCMRQAEAEVNENIFPKHIRADQCNPGVMPTIIKEVFFPPDAPMEVATLMESALVY